MAEWSRWSVVFFAYLAVVAEIRPGVALRSKVRIWAAGAVGAAVALASMRLPPDGVANVWILPGAVLFIGYWTSGLTFVRASPAAEAALLENAEAYVTRPEPGARTLVWTDAFSSLLQVLK